MPTTPSSLARRFTLVHLGEGHQVPVLLPEPDTLPARPLVGRDGLLRDCRAAWLAAPSETPLHFRLTGPPGVGKNEVVYALARAEGRPLFVLQGHEELMPEDLACTGRIVGDGRVEYVGSPLLAAMLRGGVCFLDEIGKVPPRALSLLASVLDDRRSLTSILAGFTVTAAPEFRFCAAMNDSDAATSGLPGFIDERLRPVFRVGYQTANELLAIVESRADSGARPLLERFKLWLARQERPLSPRQALQIVSLAVRLLDGHASRPGGADDVIARAAALIAGEAALDANAPRARTREGRSQTQRSGDRRLFA